MVENLRPAPFFVADHVALDFINSVAAPWGTEIEWLANGNDLLTWLEHADLIPSEALNKFRKGDEVGQLDVIATRARELREWFRCFISNYAGQPLQPDVINQLGEINRLLAEDNQFYQIESIGKSPQPNRINHVVLDWRLHRRWHSANALLLPIAESMGHLISQADFSLIKNCEGPTCPLWFYDVSKNHARRWCSMAVCGNRAKAAAHRARNKGTSRL